ncbi:alpha-N-acetylgalactosaminide alpha-2,6-sialyltransferase 2 [Pteropus vampyrus]|uniref:alpha-N-acetylgalactosaminide alpha-2,6-sialyltransferase n=1 Tax=Pteropus vampyrus TaxID=132908 RepID=A0A6P6CJ53_PTEVA|nr:alpha-N-acetylgalactosaminide alpha-2,6-sialyltransferase 2 [Pteropus vampyrus]
MEFEEFVPAHRANDSEADMNTVTPRASSGPKAATDSGTRKSRPCRRPLYLAVQRHPHFQGLFDFSTPVLLSGGVFTQELWDHLSQHKAPYGWQGLSRQAIASTLGLLNGSESAQLFASRERLRDCVRCAVVGNGGILNGSRQGRNIDAHDYVFRLNGAVIKDFEDDVGTKTASSLTPSPHIPHVPRGSTPNPTPPTSKSPSQSALKSISRNASQTPPVPLARSSSHSSASYIGPVRGIPSCITPYVPSFLKEPPFFQPPTAPLPQFCFPSPVSKHTPVPESLYFPLLPPPPHQPQVRCSYPTPPALFTPPSSLTYTPPIDVLVRGKPHVVPSLLPPTFYTPFSRYYSHPRPHRPIPRRRPSPTFSLPSMPQTYFGPEASASKFKLLHPDFISYLTERCLSEFMSPYESAYSRSSINAHSMTILVQVSAYGFITSNYQKFSDHYFERKKMPLIFYANHDLSLESTLWRDLHNAGILWLYQR